MADATNPSPPPAEPAEPSLEAEIMDVFELGDTRSDADAIAAKAGDQPSATGQSSPAPAEAGGGPAAPVPPPDTSSPAPTEAEPAPAAPEPAPAPASAAPAAPSPAPAPQPAAPQPSADESALRTASLEAQVNALTEELNRLRASPQPQPAGAPAPVAAPAAAPESGQPAAEQPFRYNLTLPQPVADALQSDDPQVFNQGVTAIINDLGTIVHHTVVAQVRGEVAATLQALEQRASQLGETETRAEAMKKGQEEYYADFPDHNNPLILPIIQAEARSMAAEFPHLSWGPQYKAALGARVNGVLEKLGARAPAPAGEPPAPVPVPPARPAPMLPAGARGGGGPAADDVNSPEAIGSVLSVFGGDE